MPKAGKVIMRLSSLQELVFDENGKLEESGEIWRTYRSIGAWNIRVCQLSEARDC